MALGLEVSPLWFPQAYQARGSRSALFLSEIPSDALAFVLQSHRVCVARLPVCDVKRLLDY